MDNQLAQLTTAGLLIRRARCMFLLPEEVKSCEHELQRRAQEGDALAQLWMRDFYGVRQ